MNTKNIQEIYSEVLSNKDNFLATANQFLESNYWAIELDTPLVPLTAFCKARLSPYLVKYLEEHKPAHEAEPSNEIEPSKGIEPSKEIEFSNEIELSNEFIFALYETSLKCYERDVMKRANDSLPKRIRVLLWHVDKKTCTLLNIDCPNSGNKSEDVTKAKERDVPKLLKIYPNLPELKF